MSSNEEAVKEEVSAAPEPIQTLGGEIHIVADGKTGAVSVQAPPNLAIALGLIELAKVVLVQQHLESMRAQQARRPPAIIPAGMDVIKNLKRMS